MPEERKTLDQRTQMTDIERLRLIKIIQLRLERNLGEAIRLLQAKKREVLGA